MLIDTRAIVDAKLLDNGEFVIDIGNRDEIVGYLGNLYDSVSFQKMEDGKYLVKYNNKRK